LLSWDGLKGFMKRSFRFGAIAMLAATTLLGLQFKGAIAGPRPHVYLFRGLADIFSAGMDTLTEELKKNGVYATSHSQTNWKPIADRAAADFKAKKEGPIIIIGHSLGADAAMEMADYLGDKGVPVALVVPFDGTQSFPVPANVARVVNFTQRDYAYMRPGPGFHGSLNNVDLSANPDIGHLNIDKSPELHARAVREVLAVIGGRRRPAPAATKPAAMSPVERSRSAAPATAAPAREPSAGRLPDSIAQPGTASLPDNGTSSIAKPETSGQSKRSAAPAPMLPTINPASPPQLIGPAQIPN
jgi:pimeloyl-ACP methyl ester carboxylesterase